jgi:hypothetical protein
MVRIRLKEPSHESALRHERWARFVVTKSRPWYPWLFWAFAAVWIGLSIQAGLHDDDWEGVWK